MQWMMECLQLLWLWVQAHPEAALAALVWMVAHAPIKNIYLAWLAKMAVQYAQQWEKQQLADPAKPTPTNSQLLERAMDFLESRGVKVPGALVTLIESQVWAVKHLGPLGN